MELKQTFSIQLPVDLYGELLKKAGKGRISVYIREVLEEKLQHEKHCLGQAYKECYTNNLRLLEEAELWERAQTEDWLNYLSKPTNKNKNK